MRNWKMNSMRVLNLAKYLHQQEFYKLSNEHLVGKFTYMEDTDGVPFKLGFPVTLSQLQTSLNKEFKTVFTLHEIYQATLHLTDRTHECKYGESYCGEGEYLLEEYIPDQNFIIHFLDRDEDENILHF